MPLESLVFLDVIINASFLLTATAFFFSAAIFGDALFVRFDLKTFIKFLGFLFLGVAFVLNLLNNMYPGLNYWLMSAALVLIFVGFIIDPLSKFKFIAPLPVVFFPFLTGHILFFVLGLASTFAIFQLAYTTRHRDLIPLGVSFTLTSIGEYLYHLKDIEQLKQLALAGSFLYLFASLILLGWVWSYLAIRFVNRFKPSVAV
ncbi:MAG: hypothetical protein Q7S79_01540 [bacterium]|nr:hypothetical protein [bacterium]